MSSDKDNVPQPASFVIRHRKRLTEIAVVLVIIAVQFMCLWPAVRQTMPEDGPRGEDIPSTPPDETRRAQIGPGVSIVLPPNWVNRRGWEVAATREVGETGGMVQISPRTGASRSHAMVLVSTGLQDPDLTGMTAMTFQGIPAHESMVVEREGSWDDPARSVYRLLLNRKGQWWEIEYLVAQETTTLPPMVRRYLETIRFDDDTSD